jgi:hypothetical protein
MAVFWWSRIYCKKRTHVTSGTIKATLSSPGHFAENENNEVNLERPLHMCFQKYACVLLTRFATLTSPRFLKSPLHPKLHWNCWWLQTSKTVK